MCTHRYFCWVACVCNCKVKKCWKVSRVCVGQELPVGCTIVGDPQHDIINLSKVLHFRAADKEDLQKDHIDMTHRLSAADSPVSASKEVVPECQGFFHLPKRAVFSLSGALVGLLIPGRFLCVDAVLCGNARAEAAIILQVLSSVVLVSEQKLVLLPLESRF